MTNQYWVIPGSESLHESQESHGGSSAPNPLVQLDPGLFIWTIITFVVLFLILAKFAWKPLLNALKEREDQIKLALQNAAQAKEELGKLTLKSEVITNKAREEANVILSEARETSEKIKQDMLSKATKESNKIRIEAETKIKVEKDRAVDEIKTKIVDLTIAISEKIIKKNLSSKENQKLIKDSLERLEKYSA
jgi:F-type H+-transporting ATPase subunit b